MVTATATAGGGSNDDVSAVPDAKGRGSEVIGVGCNNEDCGAGAGSSSMVVVVDRGSNGIEPMELIGIDEGCGKDAIAAAASTACAVVNGCHRCR